MVVCFPIACLLKQTFVAQSANEAIIIIPFFFRRHKATVHSQVHMQRRTFEGSHRDYVVWA